MIGDVTTERRSNCRCKHDGHSIDRKRHSPFFWLECVAQDGLLARCEAAAAEPLQHAKEDQRAERWRDTAKKRAGREERDARHVEALASDARGEPTADR